MSILVVSPIISVSRAYDISSNDLRVTFKDQVQILMKNLVEGM